MRTIGENEQMVYSVDLRRYFAPLGFASHISGTKIFHHFAFTPSSTTPGFCQLGRERFSAARVESSCASGKR